MLTHCEPADDSESEDSNRNEDGGWMQISYAGGSGWVYQRYLTPAGSEEVAEADTGSAPF